MYTSPCVGVPLDFALTFIMLATDRLARRNDFGEGEGESGLLSSSEDSSESIIGLLALLEGDLCSGVSDSLETSCFWVQLVPGNTLSDMSQWKVSG